MSQSSSSFLSEKIFQGCAFNQTLKYIEYNGEIIGWEASIDIDEGNDALEDSEIQAMIDCELASSGRPGIPKPNHLTKHLSRFGNPYY